MDCGHETLDNDEIIVDDLGEGSQAVGGAGGVGDDVHGLIILLVVHTHHKHRGVSRRRRDDHLHRQKHFVKIPGFWHFCHLQSNLGEIQYRIKLINRVTIMDINIGDYKREIRGNMDNNLKF